MKNVRIIDLGSLALAVSLGLAPAAQAAAAGQGAALDQSNLGDLRAWLERRNQERKVLGQAVPEIPKHRNPASGAQFRQVPRLAKLQPHEAEAGFRKPVQEIGRGPDGRIHHRLVLNEEGPDQLQVYSGSGYAPAAPDENAKQDESRWARLTPRGKRAWMSGIALRDPASSRLQDPGRR